MIRSTSGQIEIAHWRSDICISRLEIAWDAHVVTIINFRLFKILSSGVVGSFLLHLCPSALDSCLVESDINDSSLSLSLNFFSAWFFDFLTKTHVSVTHVVIIIIHGEMIVWNVMSLKLSIHLGSRHSSTQAGWWRKHGDDCNGNWRWKVHARNKW